MIEMDLQLELSQRISWAINSKLVEVNELQVDLFWEIMMICEN